MKAIALEILQNETGSFNEQSRLRDDVLDAMIAFRNAIKISEEEMKKAAEIDYQNQKKFDNAYDRKKGFEAGVKWAISYLKQIKNPERG